MHVHTYTRPDELYLKQEVLHLIEQSKGYVCIIDSSNTKLKQHLFSKEAVLISKQTIHTSIGIGQWNISVR